MPVPRITLRHVGLALVGVGAALALVLGVLQLVWHYGMFVARAAFPLDLEWMEGGMLLHAQRLAAGRTVYVPPSVDFIPFLYTPLYPALVGLLSKLFGLGYLLGRVVSIASFTGALLLVVLAASRETSAPRSRIAGIAIGLGGAGVVASSFAFTGTFYDLVRSDSLMLLLEAGAVFAAFSGTRLRSAALAGGLIALAFFTKQTASVIGVALGVGLLVANWRRGLVYGGVAAVTLAAGLLLLYVTSDGWFWTYVFKLHQSHGFNWRLAFADTPVRILRWGAALFAGLVLATIGLGLGRRLRRTDSILWAVALAGFAAACIGFGTQWAFENAFIPAVYFPALAAAVLGARLAAAAMAEARLGAAAATALVGAALAAQAWTVGRPRPQWVPGSADQQAASRFLEHLRSLPGEVFIPFHPFYNVLVGKRPHVHRMGVLDVAAMLGRPARLDEALAEKHYAWVILDWKSQPHEWPTLESSYHDVHQFRDGFDAVRMFSGAETSPRRLLAATRPPPPLPAHAARLADFESGWSGWVPDGPAFGSQPGPARGLATGRAAAASSPDGTGVLRSPPLRISQPRLRFTLDGPADPGLRVLLLDGPEVLHTATPTGSARVVDWDVSAAAGRSLTVVIEDRSTTGGLLVDDVVNLP